MGVEVLGEIIASSPHFFKRIYATGFYKSSFPLNERFLEKHYCDWFINLSIKQSGKVN